MAVKLIILLLLTTAFTYHQVFGDLILNIKKINQILYQSEFITDSFNLSLITDEGRIYDIIGDVVGKSYTGAVDLESVLHRLNFAYHIGYPADPRYWVSAFEHENQEHFELLVQIRKSQEILEEFYTYASRCLAAVEEKKKVQEGAFVPEIDRILIECQDEQSVVHKYTWPYNEQLLSERVFRSHINTGFLIAARFRFMLFVGDVYGFDDPELSDNYSVRLAPINRMADEANLDHYEIKRRIDEFQQRINDPNVKYSQSERDFFQAKLDEIKGELQGPPFDWIYSNGDDGPVEFRRDCNLHLQQEFANYPNMYNWIWETTMGDEWIKFRGHDLNQDSLDLELLKNVREDAMKYFMAHFFVDYDDTKKEWIWDWDTQNMDTCAKFVRDSWERLDRIVEKLKCYMGESYYFSKDMRKKAIERTQMDLTEAKLFSNISTTLFRPCRKFAFQISFCKIITKVNCQMNMMIVLSFCVQELLMTAIW